MEFSKVQIGSQVPIFFSFFVFVLMSASVISAPIMMSVRNFTDLDFLFVSNAFARCPLLVLSSLNKILEIIFVQRAKEEAE